MDLERCVFHARTPRNSAIDELLPLSALEHSDPRAFARAIAKYDDTPERRRLRETWIPGLEARWTEVVFLSPVQPHAIWRAWRDVAGTELPPQEFWAIEVEAIGDAVVLDRHLSRTGDPIETEEVTRLDPDTYRSREATTAKNEEWIAQLAAGEARSLVPRDSPRAHAAPGAVDLRRRDRLERAVNATQAPPFRIRQAVPGDALGCARVHHTAWVETYSSLLPASHWETDTLEGREQTWLRWASGSTAVTVAEIDGEIIGFAMAGTARRIDEHAPVRDHELFSLYVLAAHHGSGAGQALLEAVLHTGAPAQLWVAEENPRARRFYTRNGFTPDGARFVDQSLGLAEVRLVR